MLVPHRHVAFALFLCFEFWEFFSGLLSLDQIKELLGSFSRSFEEKFQNMPNRIDNLSQDVTNANNPSFSAPYAVAYA